MAEIMVAIYVTILDNLHSRNENGIDLDIRMDEGQIKICQSKVHMRLFSFYLFPVVMFSICATISEIFAVEVYMTLTFAV